MRVKKIKIGFKNLKSALNDFVKTGEALERSLKVKKESGTYFTSFEAFRKALTPRRIELLHIIKIKRPSSINELARVAGRDIKNIAGDVRYLESIGLIEIKEGSRKASPVINYDRIAFEIAV